MHQIKDRMELSPTNINSGVGNTVTLLEETTLKGRLTKLKLGMVFNLY